MPVPGIVLRILDEVDRAGLWINVVNGHLQVLPKDRIPPGLADEIYIDREDLRIYLDGVERIREREAVSLPHNSPQHRWPRCWWRYRSEWEAAMARDVELGWYPPPPEVRRR